MSRRFMSIDRNVNVITSDSEDEINKPSSWLPGGTMIATWGRVANLIVPNSEIREELGRWSSVQISSNR